MSTWDIGDLITLSAQYRNAAGNPADPDTATLKVRKPDGTLVVVTPNHDGGGQYSFQVGIDQSGTWAYRFEGTGAVYAAEEATFSVRRSKVLA